MRLAADSSLLLSSRSAGWADLTLERQLLPPATVKDRFLTEHLISVRVGPGHSADAAGDWSRSGTSPALGDVRVVPAWVVGSAEWHERIEVLNVALKPDYLDRLAEETTGSGPPRFAGESVGPDRQLGHLVWILAAEAEAGQRGDPLLVEVLTMAVGLRLLHNYTVHSDGMSVESARPVRRSSLLVARVRARVDEALDQPLTVAALAAAENLSLYHFTRSFTAAAGVSPYRYVTRRRVERAKDLVVHTDLPVAEIARQCGFTSPAQMTRAFRRNLNVTPTALRHGD